MMAGQYYCYSTYWYRYVYYLYFFENPCHITAQTTVWDSPLYRYDGDVPVNERGLTIGGYESAWLADLVISYLLETVDQRLLNELKYFGIYRDDGLGIFEGNKSTVEVNDWLNKFQSSINHQATNDFLQFKAEVWKPGENNMENVGKTSVNNCDYFPFLDMEMRWGANSELTFNVHIKPNQEIKYLNDGSSHTPGCFKAITTGVLLPTHHAHFNQ